MYLYLTILWQFSPTLVFMLTSMLWNLQNDNTSISSKSLLISKPNISIRLSCLINRDTNLQFSPPQSIKDIIILRFQTIGLETISTSIDQIGNIVEKCMKLHYVGNPFLSVHSVAAKVSRPQEKQPIPTSKKHIITITITSKTNTIRNKSLHLYQTRNLPLLSQLTFPTHSFKKCTSRVEKMARKNVSGQTVLNLNVRTLYRSEKRRHKAL